MSKLWKWQKQILGFGTRENVSAQTYVFVGKKKHSCFGRFHKLCVKGGCLACYGGDFSLSSSLSKVPVLLFSPLIS